MPQPLQPFPPRPGEVIYQVFPDRFRNGRSDLTPQPGQWNWNGRPIAVSPDPADLCDPKRHQYTFFGGDLPGVTMSVDYFRRLGVTSIYLNPIFHSPSTHRYDTVDYERVDPALGSRADFEHLASSLREASMRLILDGVFNHTSGDHPWHRNPETRRSLYVTKRDSDKTMTWMNSGHLPKLDLQNAAAAEKIFHVVRSWPEADGWRLDAGHLLPAEFLRRLKEAAGERELIIEDWHFSAHYFAQGLADSVTNMPFREAMRTFFVEDCSPETLLSRLGYYIDAYPAGACHRVWNFLDNHDVSRFLHEVGRARLLRALTLLFTLPGTPMLFQGDEVGMSGNGEAEARRPMDWNEATWDREIFDHVCALIQLRRSYPALAIGGYRPLAADNRSRTLVFERSGPGEDAWKAASASGSAMLGSVAGAEESIIVALNDGYQPGRVRIAEAGIDAVLEPGQTRLWRRGGEAGAVEVPLEG